MKRQRFAVALLFLLAGTALAAETWISAKAIDLVRYLPPPPAPDSEAQRRDLAAVLAIQATRTEAQVREAQDDQQVSIFRFADVLGSGFSAERLPRTAKLAQRACGQTSLVTAAAKRFWNRPRPYLVSAEVRRVIENVTEGSYPSGHATCGYLWAILLADILPERRAEVFERGVRYGMNRVVGGVHYPADVEAGRMSAAIITAALFANPQFRADLEVVRAEVRAAMGYAAAAAGF